MIPFAPGFVILIIKVTHLKDKMTEKEESILLLLMFPFTIMTWGKGLEHILLDHIFYVL